MLVLKVQIWQWSAPIWRATASPSLMTKMSGKQWQRIWSGSSGSRSLNKIRCWWSGSGTRVRGQRRLTFSNCRLTAIQSPISLSRNHSTAINYAKAACNWWWASVTPGYDESDKQVRLDSFHHSTRIKARWPTTPSGVMIFLFKLMILDSDRSNKVNKA